MTVTAENPSIEYQGDGVTVLFTFAYRLLQETDLKVFVDDVQQVLFSDYTIENLTEAGGDVVFLNPPADLTKVALIRFTVKTQQIDYEPFTPFPAESNEYGLDKLTMIVQEIEQRFIDNANPQVFSVFGRVGNVVADITDYDEFYADLNDYNAHKAGYNPHQTTIAVGDYVPGNTYDNGDEVFNGNSLSEAKIDGATSYPYVRPIGEQIAGYTGTGMVDVPHLASQVIFGNRYKNPNNNLYVNGYRIFALAGNSYRIILITEPTTVAKESELMAFTAQQTGWLTFNVDPIAVPVNSEFDMVAIVSEKDATPITVDAPYDYRTPQNASIPAPGEIVHPRSLQGSMFVSYTDDDLIDRTALIQSLSIGDIIDDNIATRWTVQSNTLENGYAIISVTPSATATSGTRTFAFETTTQTPLETPTDTGYWLTSAYPQNRGIIAIDEPYENATINETAYGVDVLFHYAYLPDETEWWLKIIGDPTGESETIRRMAADESASLPPGGDTGELLIKQSVANGDAQWEPLILDGGGA